MCIRYDETCFWLCVSKSRVYALRPVIRYERGIISWNLGTNNRLTGRTHETEGHDTFEERITECAKRIRALLDTTPEVNILRLSELLGERNIVAYQALGWLARDGKIRYAQKGNQIIISRQGRKS